MQESSLMSNFMPHGHCYFWEPYILWSHALSDSIIALAYMVIPISLLYIYQQRREFTYSWVFVLFAVFILSCGITHIFDVINIWRPIYYIDSVARIITALASIGTAAVLIKFTPRIVALPTGKQWVDLNTELNGSNEELSATNEELYASNEELQAANEKLTQLNEELALAKEEIERLSEKEILQNQQKYQDLAESISDIFFALDATFRFTYWNKASERLSGIVAEQALGKNMYSLYPELKDSPLDNFYQQVMQSGKASKFVHNIGQAYGNRTYEVNAYPTTEGISVITVDISSMQQALETNRFFKYLIDQTNDPTYWIDPHDGFRYAYVNQAACRHFGMSEEQILSMSLPEWDPTFTPATCAAHWERIKKEKSLNFETVHRVAGGKEIPVEISTNYLKYGDKEYFGGHFRNISERKAYENKIIELQQRMEGIVDSAMDAIITTDEHQRILIFNKAAEHMFGYASQEIINQPLDRLIPNRFHTNHQANIGEFSLSGKPNRKMGENRAVYGINAQGAEFPIEASISQVEVNEHTYFTVIMRDISVRLEREIQEKALNHELIRQNEQLQQFGFITSHNLRSPVASLLGLVEIFDESSFSNKMHMEAIQHIRDTAQKMDEIIQDLNQILEYQKSLDAKREPVTLKDLLESIEMLIAPAIHDSGTKIITQFEVEKIYTVKSYLHSIFHNLISNAIKYKFVDRTPIINISSTVKENVIFLTFSDNGMGIDLDKNQAKIFGLYNRFHHHVEGRGMGLHLVKTQVEALGGKVEVNSVIGEGTTFTVSLPIMPSDIN